MAVHPAHPTSLMITKFQSCASLVPTSLLMTTLGDGSYLWEKNWRLSKEDTVKAGVLLPRLFHSLPCYAKLQKNSSIDLQVAWPTGAEAIALYSFLSLKEPVPVKTPAIRVKVLKLACFPLHPNKNHVLREMRIKIKIQRD